ncbi:U2 splicing auxiliary factor [Trypanosoma vivax]|uniref:Putative U2 splicing auxiliary factor n=1 Tax=Trypanosoma vivax (strain Y486) TaxID=1055687 RepID=G0U5W4_TRYVY|nr:U2 splicing auxiliary factor [Trypanosoma vivax]CCC51265.1 putative U2 splicing auxiliary factor [Trypanosoma vivax Y486]
MYQDRCIFFSKMGACRHGDHCTKVHVRPSSSPTVLFPLMYPNPMAIEHIHDRQWDFCFERKYLRRHFEHFYKETWRTFMELGRIAELRVVSNLGDHLLGNVYIRFEESSDAARIVRELKAKKLNEIILLPEISPVTNFADACCKEDLEGKCERGTQCNYLHIMKVSRKLMDKLEKEQAKFWKKKDKHGGGSEKSGGSSRKRDRSKERGRDKQKSPRPYANEVCHICATAGHISRDCPLK